MKLTIIIILLSTLQLPARVFSQNNITLKLQSVQLQKALVQIEKKSNYRFLYNNDVIKIDIDAIDKLCKYLDCAPGDIILYVDDDESQHNKKEQPY